MKRIEGVIVGCLLLCGLGVSPLAQACSTDAWLGGVTGLGSTLTVGSPTANPRYSDLCAMRVTGTGSVRDLSPSHTRLRARFYVFPNQLAGSGDVVLFRAYPNETDTSPLFEIRRNNGNLVFDTAGANGGTPTSTTVTAPTNWTAIEFDWQSGGTMNIWVNVDAATAPATTTVASGTGTVSSVRLGAVAGLGGFTGALVFDAYEAHSTTAVGLLLVGDANGNGTVNSTDATRVFNESGVGGTLSTGQPDCNLNGIVNSTDATCIFAKSALP